MIGDEDALVAQAQDSSFDEDLPPSVNSGVRQVTHSLQERLHLFNREAIPVLLGVDPAPQHGGYEPAVAAPAEDSPVHGGLDGPPILVLQQEITERDSYFTERDIYYLMERLLIDIEKNGGFSQVVDECGNLGRVPNFDLQIILNEDPHTYGFQDSFLRKKAERKYKILRNMPDDRYFELLYSFNIHIFDD